MLNQIIIATLPLIPKPIVKVFAGKYIAGDELSDAVRVTQEFEKLGGMTTIDVLGEFVTSRERALHEKSMSMKVLDSISKNNLKTYLSIKPTSVGLGIDFDFGLENVTELVDKAKQLGIFLRIDMENSPYTTSTLNLYKTLRDKGYDNVGIVLQAYMKRSMDDLMALKDYKPSIRLCKGIYREDASIAYKGYEEVRDNYKKLLVQMLDLGLYVGIATHDDVLIDFGLDQVKSRNLTKDKYEFQMLLGVKESRRNQILKMGHNLRIYVPFGKDWYGYSVRRLKENPQMAGHIFKSLFKFN